MKIRLQGNRGTIRTPVKYSPGCHPTFHIYPRTIKLFKAQMICDRIENLSHYDVPHKADILAFLKANDPGAFPVGEIAIKGRELFVRPSEYETKKPEEGKFETHRVYADLQYVAKGAEIMQTAPADALESLTDYDPKGDQQFFSASRGIFSHLVKAGEFAIFWPKEAHRPCCSPSDNPVKVKKLVFKIRMA